MKNIGIVRFPGTNCDQDVFNWAANILLNFQQSLASVSDAQQLSIRWVDFQEEFDPSLFQAILIPGGFSYGDYLRCGALAAHSPVMKSIKSFADQGGFVLGICNGFQILCEAGLLPGALVKNTQGQFIDGIVGLQIENEFDFFPQLKKNRDSDHLNKLQIPIAHGEGRFVIDAEGLENLKRHQQVWLTYTENPNGSLENIAGICNQQKNIFGLMPHPERAYLPWMESKDGGFFTWKLSLKNTESANLNLNL